MSLKPLAPEDLAAARKWLAKIDAGTRERAEVLHRRQAVKEIQSAPGRIGFHATVAGDTGIYETVVRSDRRAWRGECSCPVHFDCKHAVALMLAAFDEMSVSSLTPEEQARRREAKIFEWREWLGEQARRVAEPVEPTELRVRLARTGILLEWRKSGAREFAPLRDQNFFRFTKLGYQGAPPFEGPSAQIWRSFDRGYLANPQIPFSDTDCERVLNTLLRTPELAERVVGTDGQPLRRAEESLAWTVETPVGSDGDYRFMLTMPDGSLPPPSLIVLKGAPPFYITETTIFPTPSLGGLDTAEAVAIPAAAIETREGLALFRRIGAPLPEALQERTMKIDLRPKVRCWIEPQPFTERELVCMQVVAESVNGTAVEVYGKNGWETAPEASSADLHEHDHAALDAATDFADAFGGKWFAHRGHWHRVVSVKFPAFFAEWLASAPPDVPIVLEGVLASFRESAISAEVKLEVAEAGIDWFDVRIALNVADTTLTKREIKALLDARGGYVRLGSKGWRRLALQFSPEDQAQLADLGLNPGEFSGEAQRLHALQLASKSGARKMLGEDQARVIERRAEEIRTRITPDVPATIRAELRPYQVGGFHFLAYLSANRFGGILADDMGLGKTLQTLSWIEWLRAQPNCERQPTLVVCPKSVMDNWRAEAARFTPNLRVQILPIGATPDDVEAARANAEIVVANYAQLRLLEGPLGVAPWLAAILDEAQAIKNPESQTARIAWKLKAGHRLALSGTPIENRLLDLWSILQFAMPGVLGNRHAFSKSFDQRGDPLARRRLSARVRPFVLRRTKNEVAKDLPERIEEDLHCTLDGPQLTLYRAELKRARASILQLTTQADLDASRFNVLTSLLRLRQICCHPALVSDKAAKAESAKLSALLDVVEPLIEEGHKVLVFSQFVEMLSLIRAEFVARDWPHFLLTGDTENRGELVEKFQTMEGGAVFLISLRAGGFGLNLTAASYVVLFDPWWNPAVENQAIDRTHRIGQRNTVIAYRLLVKDTIEEKIRALQTQKSALAADILGEESFARTLTLDDFRFLLGGEEET